MSNIVMIFLKNIFELLFNKTIKMSILLYMIPYKFNINYNICNIYYNILLFYGIFLL